MWANNEALSCNARPIKGAMKQGLLVTTKLCWTDPSSKTGKSEVVNMTNQKINLQKGQNLAKFWSPPTDRVALVKWMSKDICEKNASLAELQEQELIEEEDYEWPIPKPDLLSEISLGHLGEEERDQLSEVVMKFKEQFDGSLRLTHLAKHSIKLDPPCRLSPIERDAEEKHINLLKSQRVIEPGSGP